MDIELATVHSDAMDPFHRATADPWLHSHAIDRLDSRQMVESTSKKSVFMVHSSMGTEVAANRSNSHQVILSTAVAVELDSCSQMDHSYRIAPSLLIIEVLICHQQATSGGIVSA